MGFTTCVEGQMHLCRGLADAAMLLHLAGVASS